MSQPFIDFAFVKENASFERVLDHYKIVARGTGPQRSLSCPFHPDKRPSCRVELDRKIFNCFACGISGNILEFVARMEGDAEDLRSAAIKLAAICGIATAAARGKPAGKAGQAPPHSPKVARAPKPQAEPKSAPDAPPEAADGPTNPPLTFRAQARPIAPVSRRARRLGRDDRRLRPRVLLTRGDGRPGLYSDPQRRRRTRRLRRALARRRT
ncbi:MAG: hypothetical protein JO001_03505 [Alphaproteobacteria bacterium]|nr:hypothetical protein [Alphaproteobacteria bacterium]